MYIYICIYIYVYVYIYIYIYVCIQYISICNQKGSQCALPVVNQALPNNF